MIRQSVPKFDARTMAPIRGAAAVVAAFGVGCSTLSLHLWYGRPLWQAASASAAGVVTGLTGWVVYHTVSRRSDGLATVILGGIVTGSHHVPYMPFLPRVAIGLVQIVPIALVVGLWARGLKTGGTAPEPGHPMYDAEAGRVTVQPATDGEA